MTVGCRHPERLAELLEYHETASKRLWLRADCGSQNALVFPPFGGSDQSRKKHLSAPLAAIYNFFPQIDTSFTTSAHFAPSDP